MNCPDCGIGMEEHSVQGITIDLCRRCSGIWFDEGELHQYLRDLAPDVNAVPSEAVFAPCTNDLQLPCPRCRESAVEHGVLHGYSFRRCTACNGTFLGEQLSDLVKLYSSSGYDPTSNSADTTEVSVLLVLEAIFYSLLALAP